MNYTKWTLATFAAILLLVGGVLFKEHWLPNASPADAGNAALPVSPGTQAVAPQAPVAAGPRDPGSSANQALPAWMVGQDGKKKEAAAPAGSAGPQDEARAVRMQAAVARLEKLQSQGASLQPGEVEEAMLELEKANGSSVLHGVRLDVLRENLIVASRMQKLVGEIQAIQERKPLAERDSQQQADLTRKMAELDTLQRAFRTDFQAAPVAPRQP
jgi:hypothetical protein